MKERIKENNFNSIAAENIAIESEISNIALFFRESIKNAVILQDCPIVTSDSIQYPTIQTTNRSFSNRIFEEREELNLYFHYNDIYYNTTIYKEKNI